MMGSVVSATTGAVYGRGARISKADQFLAAAEELIGLAHDDFEAGRHDVAMENALLDNRYDLQYVLYLLALHRQLKARLADYDYDLHMGGAVYLFVRGSRAASQGAWFTRPPRELIESLDLLFQGRALIQEETLSGDLA